MIKTNEELNNFDEIKNFSSQIRFHTMRKNMNLTQRRIQRKIKHYRN